MTKSDLLRFHDVRDAYRLIGDCRDVGGDPVLWHRRMLEGLCRLLGARAATGGEGRWVRPHRDIEATFAVDVGIDSRAHELYVAYMRDLGPGADPIFQAMGQLPGRLVVRTRRELVSDRRWYRSRAWDEYRRPIDIDDQLTSIFQTSDAGIVSVIAILRASGERDFSARERRLLTSFHEELGRLIGHALVSATEPTPPRLSRRLGQTLTCLLEGDTEKQVAARLGLSHATVHQYVTALYRHFGVGSRAQLLAHVMKRIDREGRAYVEPSEDIAVDIRRRPARSGHGAPKRTRDSRG
jgi:DNA-binding NarL/FixJ family response regulator